MKLFIDECLCPELVHMARERGHGESSHVVWIGRQGIKDWDLLKIVLEGDFTLVTRNAFDLRGPEAAPGTRGQYQRAQIHAGLICLNGPEGMDLDMQRDLFEAALDELDRDSDLANVVLELTLELNPTRSSSTATRSRRIKKVENRPPGHLAVAANITQVVSPEHRVLKLIRLSARCKQLSRRKAGRPLACACRAASWCSGLSLP